jgi:integrase
LPRWGKLQAGAITSADVKMAMTTIAAPQVANQALAFGSAIFNWGIRESVVSVNPCALIEKNPTQSRERVLSESEVPQFWKAFDALPPIEGTQLKLGLLLGQRPGESGASTSSMAGGKCRGKRCLN